MVQQSHFVEWKKLINFAKCLKVDEFRGPTKFRSSVVNS